MMGDIYLCSTDLVYISLRDIVLTADTIMLTFVHHFICSQPVEAFRLYITCSDSLVAHCIDEEDGITVSVQLENHVMDYASKMFVPMLTGESDIW